jgi:hypothetical protein
LRRRSNEGLPATDIKRHDRRKVFIRNIVEVPWLKFPNHFGGALSKPLVVTSPVTAAEKPV